ncbi:MAG: alanine/glycine:cation symporter family protein [Blautia sp.]
MKQILHIIHAFVWSPGMLVFFLATGIRFTLKSGFFPLTHGKQWFLATFGSLFGKEEIRKTKEQHSISQFQSFCTALAATLGTGNITGVAAAIMAGGPGAVFWMWVSAFFGMMTNYAENYLGILYRYKDRNGQWVGGAMVYMDRGLSCRWLAVFFSFCCIGASFGMGNMVQGNSMAKGLESAFHIPVMVTGTVATAAVAYVLMGGMKRIAALTEKLVPAMAVLYLTAAVLVLVVYRDRIGTAFMSILTEAFHPKAMCGGMTGYTVGIALQTGVARGIFSNEAGLGSSVIAHAQSDVKDPKIQGMWGIAEIFADTMVVCTITALVILVSGVYRPEICLQNIAAGIENIDGTTLTGRAFSTVIPYGEQLLSGATLLFAFATIVGWSCFGERTAAYLGGTKGAAVYKIIYILITLPGCIMTPGIIWELSDTLNGLMAIPNLIALFFLGKEIHYPKKHE